MQAIVIRAHGGPEVLRQEDAPTPDPGPGEVRVRVTHVGMNHLDVWVRRGVPGHTFPLPLIPGSDVVGVREDTGEVVALMPAVSCLACERCHEGRQDLCRSYRIRGEGMNGGCCEAVVVPAWQCLPTRLPPEQAAALPLALLTAWHMLSRANLVSGQTVLVQAGAGGVASLVIQIARHLGARVFATASTPEKRALCLALGAEAAWSYEDAAAGVRAATGREGVDVVVEHVGAATWALSLRCLRWGGALVTCGATSGHEVTLDLRALFFKQISLVGATMGSFAELRQAWRAVEAGAVRPVLDSVVPMSALAVGHARLERRDVLGKIVLVQDLTG